MLNAMAPIDSDVVAGVGVTDVHVGPAALDRLVVSHNPPLTAPSNMEFGEPGTGATTLMAPMTGFGLAPPIPMPSV